MVDYFSKLNKAQINNTFYDKLVQVSEQFSKKYSKSHKLTSYVASGESSHDSKLEITLNIMTLDNSTPYFYTLINVKQEIGEESKAMVSAFVNQPTDKTEILIEDFDDFIINDVFGIIRFNVVIEMVSQMGNTIKQWENESQEFNQND